MVLQRESSVRIWGWGKAGSTVAAGIGEARATGTVAGDGRWSVQLEPLAASFEGRTLWVECGDERREFEDVLVGDVWICGGQSNMEWPLRASRDADVEIPSADQPHVRYLRLPKVARSQPQEDFPVKGKEASGGPWRACTPPDVEHCTGVGYYFGRRLQRRLHIPIGLVDVSWGGTMAQHWVKQETLREIPQMERYLDEFAGKVAAFAEGGGEEGAAQRLAADLAAWEEARAEAEAAGEKAPRRPNPDAYTDPALKGQPGGMLNGMIHPIARATVKGVLFYQGENNSFGESWKPFHRTFPAVIEDWRALFGVADLPFGIIQIAGWSNRRDMHYDMNHHTNIVREIQFDTWRSTENTGLIVTFDTNTNQSIHPARKLTVGERSARWALSEVYGILRHGSDQPLQWRGPVYESSRVEDGKVIVSFEDGTDHRLLLDQDVEAGFYIAGEDQIFHHARARVRGGENDLVVWSDEVPEPVAVRYGWSNLPAGGLMNFRELPAYPFRTDAWPMTPHQSEGSYLRQEN